MKSQAELEKIIKRIPTTDPRVNVGVLKTHHKIIKMIAAQREHSVQQTIDILLQRTLVEMNDVGIQDIIAWCEELNPEKKEPRIDNQEREPLERRSEASRELRKKRSST